MKLSKISMGVAAACGLLAAPAFAITANNYTNTSEFDTGATGDTMNIRISGATAQDPGLQALIVSNYCQAGTLHRYSISNNFVYFCTTNSSATGLTPRAGTTKLAVYKYSVLGSGGGVSPVNNPSAAAAGGSVAGGLTPFLDLKQIATGTLCSGANATQNPTITAFVDITCAAANAPLLTTPAVSYIGLSDVEPAFFGAANTYNNLDAVPLATVIFGVPVTKNIYEALQTQQGLPVGGTNEADMPTLTQAQLTTIYTQQGQSWANLGITSGLTDDGIYVVRRIDSSGTQKTFEGLIARTTNSTGGAKSCQTDVDPFVADITVNDNTAADAQCNAATAGSTVIAGNGGGQVTQCLNGHQNKSRGAIGMLSTETSQTAASLWRFVKVNGFAPTKNRVASGSYTQYADASLNTRKANAALPFNNLPTASALGYPAFITKFKADFAGSVSGVGSQPFGAAGVMPLDAAALVNNTLGKNPWTRLVGGTTLNNCQPGKLN
jgi:ABC-type phosphate transport system substrate-binding protein